MLTQRIISLTIAFFAGVALAIWIAVLIVRGADNWQSTRIADLEQKNRVLTGDVARTAAHGVATEINLIRCREAK